MKWKRYIKKDPNQWVTITNPKEFRYKINNGSWYNAFEANKVGSYNTMLQNCSKELYDTNKVVGAESDQIFRNALTNGFMWEVIKVYSGPPRCSFQWRHWGYLNGSFNEYKGKGELVEMYGFCVATVELPQEADKRQRIKIKEF
eukprot:185236_1